MRFVFRMSPVLVCAVCLAQVPDGNQKLLEEMKGVHATLNRLVQLMEAIGKSQRAALAFQQLQVYQTRLSALESQQEVLASREGELSKRASELSQSAQALESGIGLTGAPTGATNPDPVHRKDVAEGLAAANRVLQDVRTRQQSADREMTTLRERISRLEKAVEEGLEK